jgi:hypothetical protein
VERERIRGELEGISDAASRQPFRPRLDKQSKYIAANTA